MRRPGRPESAYGDVRVHPVPASSGHSRGTALRCPVSR
jgi:hypothetical protein